MAAGDRLTAVVNALIGDLNASAKISNLDHAIGSHDKEKINEYLTAHFDLGPGVIGWLRGEDDAGVAAVVVDMLADHHAIHLVSRKNRQVLIDKLSLSPFSEYIDTLNAY